MWFDISPKVSGEVYNKCEICGTLVTDQGGYIKETGKVLCPDCYINLRDAELDSRIDRPPGDGGESEG
jgi:ribosome-binding protein aMBF1 (putative translation factor)